MTSSIQVSNYRELVQAVGQAGANITITNSILVPQTLQLAPKVSLKGEQDSKAFLAFNNGDGIALSQDNTLENLIIQTAPSARAIHINSAEEDLGRITFKDLTVTGQVQLLSRGPNKTLDVQIDGLDIIAADARARSERPLGYNVVVIQGALTVYNYAQEDDSLVTVQADRIKIGRPDAPVIGSGIFMGGAGEKGGRLQVNYLGTEEVHAHGMTPDGQPSVIIGGIFISTGAHAKEIVSRGQVVTYGVNDMVLDVWGSVDSWLVEEEVISYGNSAIGFVNFGRVKNFEAKKAIRTYGEGSRGFNQYDGTIEEASFHSIKTYGDGSIGMQFSKEVGHIKIVESIETHGGEGNSLVKGVIQQLPANGLSIKDGGAIRHLEIGQSLITHGDEVDSLVIEEGGMIHEFTIGGQIEHLGEGGNKFLIEKGVKLPQKVAATIDQASE